MRRISWDELKKMVENALESIAKYDPDIIVAVGRGGIVPASIIAYQLEKPMISMTIRLYEGGKNPRRKYRKPKLVGKFSHDVSKKKVLLVDDVSNTGETLNKAKTLMKGAMKVKTFVLYRKSGYKPDFFCMKTNDCVLFPWS
jgi:hypoxanthine phosphoribosyltransferase